MSEDEKPTVSNEESTPEGTTQCEAEEPVAAESTTEGSEESLADSSAVAEVEEDSAGEEPAGEDQPLDQTQNNDDNAAPPQVVMSTVPPIPEGPPKVSEDKPKLTCSEEVAEKSEGMAVAESLRETIQQAQDSEGKTEPPKKLTVTQIQTAIVAIAIGTVFGGMVAIKMDHVGEWLQKQGYYAEAAICYEVFTCFNCLRGANDVRTAEAWSYLASCYDRMDRHGDAIRTEQKALSLMRDTYGQDDPMYHWSLARLSNYMVANKQYGESENLLNDALRRSREIANTSLSVAYLEMALAHAYAQQKKYAQAETYYKLVFSKDEKLIERSRQSLDAREALARLLLEEKRVAEAETLVRDAIRLKQKYMGPNDIYLAYSYETLAKVLLADGKMSEAQNCVNQATKILESKFGTADPRVRYARASFDKTLHPERHPQ